MFRKAILIGFCFAFSLCSYAQEHSVTTSLTHDRETAALTKKDCNVISPIEHNRVLMTPIESTRDVTTPIENTRDVTTPIEDTRDVIAPIESTRDVISPIENTRNVITSKDLNKANNITSVKEDEKKHVEEKQNVSVAKETKSTKSSPSNDSTVLSQTKAKEKKEKKTKENLKDSTIVKENVKEQIETKTEKLNEPIAEKQVANVNETKGNVTYVDLGLSVKWATYNVGANKPEGYGTYYAWGETTSKNTCNWSSYKYCEGSSEVQTKYCTSASYGVVDNKKVLDSSDDVAYVILGPNWRIPTATEWNELRTKCTWTWTTVNGVHGYKVSAANGNSIFLPATGYRADSDINGVGSFGYYWTSSLYEDNSTDAWSLNFRSGHVYKYNYNRCYGSSIRPVYVK